MVSDNGNAERLAKKKLAAVVRLARRDRDAKLAGGFLCDLPAHEKQCQKCGVTKPWSEFRIRKATRDGMNGTCRACTVKRAADWAAANPEKARASKRAWKMRNPEYMRARQRIDKARAYARHGVKLRAATRAWAAANREKVRARYTSPCGRMLRRLAQQRRNARAAAAENTLSLAEWQHILEAFGHACAYCRRPWADEDCHMDHVIPLSKGGGFTRRNIVPSCADCNRSKNARPHDEWCAERGLSAAAILAPLAIEWNAPEVPQTRTLRPRPAKAA